MKLKLILIFFLFSLAISASAFTETDKKFNASSQDTSIQIIDSTLRKVWEINNDTTASYQLVLSDNKIFSPLDDGLIYCYDFNGKEKWVAEVFGDIQNNLVHYKDLILTSTSSGDLYSINANNGDVVQVMGIGESITSNLALIDLANADTKSKGIVFGTESGTIYCYDIFSFERIWEIKLSRFPITANPFSIDDKIFFRDSLSTIYSVGTKSGSLIWKHEFAKNESEKNNSQIFSDGIRVFILSPTQELVALDVLLGKVLWSTKKLDIYSQVQVSNDKNYLIALNKKGSLMLFSSTDGKEIKRIYLAKENINSFYYDDSEGYSLLALSDGSISLVDDKYEIRPILKLNNEIIKTLKTLPKNQFLISTQSGKLLLFRFEQ